MRSRVIGEGSRRRWAIFSLGFDRSSAERETEWGKRRDELKVVVREAINAGDLSRTDLWSPGRQRAEWCCVLPRGNSVDDRGIGSAHSNKEQSRGEGKPKLLALDSDSDSE
ncbi:hypothetical protein Ancab_025984 [Ancistrocladus abbreviatus]